jgi:DNA-binding MarR family transcriptional regulator
MARTVLEKRSAPAAREARGALPDDRLSLLVKEANRALVRALQARLGGHAVSPGHWQFLRILWQRDGLTQRALSELAGVMEPTTFSALKGMELAGYVERRQMPENRKNVYVFLTARGRALQRKLAPLAEEVNRVAIEGIDPAQLALVRRVLAALLANLERDDAPAAERRVKA